MLITMFGWWFKWGPLCSGHNWIKSSPGTKDLTPFRHLSTIVTKLAQVYCNFQVSWIYTGFFITLLKIIFAINCWSIVTKKLFPEDISKLAVKFLLDKPLDITLYHALIFYLNFRKLLKDIVFKVFGPKTFKNLCLWWFQSSKPSKTCNGSAPKTPLITFIAIV